MRFLESCKKAMGLYTVQCKILQFKLHENRCERDSILN